MQITKELTEDYPNKIRVAREKLRLTHEELGKKINEKASVLRNLETGKMAPNNQFASKLEHMLKNQVAWFQFLKKKPPLVPKGGNQELTLGDLIEMNEKSGEAATKRKQS